LDNNYKSMKYNDSSQQANPAQGKKPSMKF